MKKIFTIIALAFLVSSCGAKKIDYRNQYTDEVLDGIFKIRLGMSQSEIIEVVGTQYNRFTKTVWLNEYEPVEGFIIENIDLSFFEDKLYSIEICKWNSKIESLLTKKYGKPKTKKEEKGEAIPYGERTDKWDTYRVVEETYINTWETNSKNIICISEYYSKRGEFSSSYSLIIKDKEIEKKMLDRYWEKKREIEEKDKKILLEEI